MDTPASPRHSMFTLLGPLAWPKIINLAFQAGSISVTNQSDKSLYLDDSSSKTNLTGAKITIPPHMIHHIVAWQANTLFISGSSDLVLGDQVLFQVSEDVKPTPASTIIPTFIDISLGDSIPNPGDLPVQASFNWIYEESLGLWYRQRAAKPAAGIISSSAAAVVPYFWDDVNSGWAPFQRANDGILPEAMPSIVPALWNGTTLDRQRNNTPSQAILALAGRTVLTTSGVLTNHNARGILLTLFVSAKGGATTLTLIFLSHDDLVGANIVTATSGAFAAAVGVMYSWLLYPGVTPAAAGAVQALSLAVPRSFLMQVNPSDATSVTYSLNFSPIV